MKTQTGFTLIELVIATGIIGILAVVAYPSWLAQEQKGRRSDALTSVTTISSSLERCYAQAYTYAGCANASVGTINSTQGYYQITTAVTPTTYTITATPLGPQVPDISCATIVYTNTGQSSTNSIGVDSTKTCWGSS